MPTTCSQPVIFPLSILRVSLFLSLAMLLLTNARVQNASSIPLVLNVTQHMVPRQKPISNFQLPFPYQRNTKCLAVFVLVNIFSSHCSSCSPQVSTILHPHKKTTSIVKIQGRREKKRQITPPKKEQGIKKQATKT